MKYINKKRVMIRAVIIFILMFIFDIYITQDSKVYASSLSDAFSSNANIKQQSKHIETPNIAKDTSISIDKKYKEQVDDIALKTIYEYGDIITDAEVDALYKIESSLQSSATKDEFDAHYQAYKILINNLQRRLQTLNYECLYGQKYTSANDLQKHIVQVAKCTPSSGSNYCAKWVSTVFQNSGLQYIGGNANDMYYNWCVSSDISMLKVGMIIAVPSHNHDYAGNQWGHVGIYIGDGLIIENIGYIHTSTLDEWIGYYGTTYSPMWGWANGNDLSN